MDGKQLKNSILQWAIQGKLVPQNPKDEPASKLLERIALSRHSERSEESSKRSKKTSKNPPFRIYRENGVWYEQVGTATPKDITDEIPFEIPENWAWCRLGDVLTDTSAGKSPQCENRPRKGNEWGVIKTTAIQDGYFLENENKVLPVKFGTVKKEQVIHEGDLLITRAGPRNRTGILCLVEKEPTNLILSDKTVRLSYIKDFVSPHYLISYLRSLYGQEEIIKNMVGMASSQVNISQDKMKTFLIPLPSLAEQKRIVAKLEQVLPLAEEYGAAQEQLDKLNKELPEALKKSILQEAIQGKLVPQNPKDEPAQKLLERIALARHSERSEESSKRSKKTSKDQSSRIYRENGVWYEQIGTATPKDITDEIPFEIPETWAWCRVERLFDVWSARRVHEKDWRKKGVPFYRAREIGKLADFGTVDNELFIDQSLYEEFSETGIPKKNDMMITAVGTLGKVYVIKDDKPFYFKDGSVLCMSNKANVDPLFYKHCIESPFFRDQYEPESGGTTVATLTMVRFNRYLVPLPPLAEQKRIVTKLEQLFKVL